MIFNTHKISHETWTLDMLIGIHLIMQATILRNDITIQQIKEDWVFFYWRMIMRPLPLAQAQSRQSSFVKPSYQLKLGVLIGDP